MPANYPPSHPYICRICEHQPQMATYEILRAHLRAVHRKKDLHINDLPLYEVFPGSRYLEESRPPPHLQANVGSSVDSSTSSEGQRNISPSINMNDVEKMIEAHVKNGLRAGMRIVNEKLNTFEANILGTIQSSVLNALQASFHDLMATHREVNVQPSNNDGENQIDHVNLTPVSSEAVITAANVSPSIENNPMIVDGITESVQPSIVKQENAPVSDSSSAPAATLAEIPPPAESAVNVIDAATNATDSDKSPSALADVHSLAEVRSHTFPCDKYPQFLSLIFNFSSPFIYRKTTLNRRSSSASKR